MKYNINIAELKEIYLVSNTASYLLNNFSHDESIQQLAKNNETAALVEAFLHIAKNEVNDVVELVTAYSFYIAIILKDDNKTYEFLKNDGIINFEWFTELRSIYFSRQKPFEIFKIDNLVEHIQGKTQFVERSEFTNTQKIEFI